MKTINIRINFSSLSVNGEYVYKVQIYAIAFYHPNINQFTEMDNTYLTEQTLT